MDKAQDKGLHSDILILSNTHVRSEWKEILLAFFERQGISHEQVTFDTVLAGTYSVVVPIDDDSLMRLLGRESLDRWHSSVLVLGHTSFAVPFLPFERVLAHWKDSAYWTLGCQKIRNLLNQEFPSPELKFHTWYSISEIREFCARCKAAPFVAVDIETSGPLVNTVGFAISGTEAMAIRVSENYWSKAELFDIWRLINDVLQSDVPKVLQNYIFETLIFASYGLEMRNVVWDTMLAMKFLNPEMEKGLDNVARIYTPFPYWKSDRGDWWKIQDWEKHLTYNCRDTTATAWAYLEQRRDFEHFGNLPAFQSLVLDFLPLIHEMCVSGIGVDTRALKSLSERAASAYDDHLSFIDRYCEMRLGRTINIASPVQLKKALKECGLKIPTIKGKESLDKKSMAKLRKKYPKDELLPVLIAAGKESKKLKSLEEIRFEHGRMTFSIDACHDEFGNWAMSEDPWGNGLDLMEAYYPTRQMFQASDGHVLIEVKLDSPVLRYVAFDSADAKLMGVLDAGNEGLHRSCASVVAGFIFGKDPDGIPERGREVKLASLALREVPFGVGPRQFIEMCIDHLDLVIDERESKRIIQAIHGHFPGLMRRCRRIQEELRRTKKLDTPLGRSRHFFDRIGDKLFREAYAFAPRATASDITNSLMLFLWRTFPDARVVLKMSDAVLLEVKAGRQYEIAEAARDYKAWHPRVRLSGGFLEIPVTCEWGTHWRPMEAL